MDALRRRLRKERIRNVTVRQQIGLEEPIIKETEQNQLTSYGHVQRMAEGRLPKIALKWMPKQKRARGRPKINWLEDIRKATNERNLNEGQWEDRKQWSLGVGKSIKKFRNRCIHTSYRYWYNLRYHMILIKFHAINNNNNNKFSSWRLLPTNLELSWLQAFRQLMHVGYCLQIIYIIKPFIIIYLSN